jgi:hypothetical protein
VTDGHERTGLRALFGAIIVLPVGLVLLVVAEQIP